jgi:hypothetical protein
MLSGILSHVLHPFAPGGRATGIRSQVRAAAVVVRWSRQLCLLPQVDEVTLTERDGSPSILVLVSPETPNYRRFIGIPARIEGFPTIVKTRSAVHAGMGD